MKRYVLNFLSVFLATLAVANSVLENKIIRFEIDDFGRLSSLKNLVSNREYAGGGALWRIVYQDGDSLEEIVESDAVAFTAKKLSDSELELSYGGDFPVKICCELSGDEIRLKPEISNASKNRVLREFQFPLVKNLNLQDTDRFVWLDGGGIQIRNLRKHLASRFSSYMAEDHNQIESGVLYPGKCAANFFMLESPKGTLYVASYDGSFTKTLHLARLRNFLKSPEIDLTMVKYPYLNAGESKKIDPYVIAPIAADWHAAADKYSAWAHTWYRQVPTAKSVENSNGWQRIILRHQYGKIFFRYNQLSEIRKSGRECGIDTLFMFGWSKEGHDSGYPEYNPDMSQGGDAALKSEIEKFQSDGGHVIVYYNGQLIDMKTDFYRNLGKKISVKVVDGTEHIERYRFGGLGTALRTFGNKTFVTACPACPEWLDHLKKLVDRAIALGADGVFFDQLGFPSESCWDVTHPHKIPCMDVMKFKNEMMRKLFAYIKSKKPDMSFGIEWLSDCTSQFADYVHNCGFSTNFVGRESNGKPYVGTVPVYRYMFPELKISDRQIRDDRDVERRVNLALMWGWFSDVEIYRCRATIDETPNYKAYLKKADTLRDRERSLILNGRFRDTTLAKISDDKLDYTTFENDSEIGVFVTNTWLDGTRKTTVSVPNATFLRSDGIGEYSVSGMGGSAEVSVQKQGLALAVFKKNSIERCKISFVTR